MAISRDNYTFMGEQQIKRMKSRKYIECLIYSSGESNQFNG
jgi:hypothetical protein